MAPVFNPDLSVEIASRSLRGLWTDQKLTSANMANADTPGYKTRQLDFDSYMDDALASLPDHRKVGPTKDYIRTDSSGSLRVDGSNVDLEEQTVRMMQNSLRYQAVLSQLGRKFDLLNSVVRDS